MILKNIPFALALIVASTLIVACGPENNLSKSDVEYVKRKQLEEKYGLYNSKTTTTTQTNTVVVTLTASNTVTIH